MSNDQRRAGRYVRGVRPVAIVGQRNATIHEIMSRYFDIRVNSASPWDPPVEAEFERGVCFVGYQVVNAPPVSKTGSTSYSMGSWYRARSGRNHWFRPKTTRRKAASDAMVFKFNRGNGVTKAIYYPEYKTLVCCMADSSMRFLNSMQSIRDRIALERGLTLLHEEAPVVEQPIRLTVGADPEFEILDWEGRVVQPNRQCFPDYTRAKIGLDGAGSQLEMRPSPGQISDVLMDMTAMMKEVKHRVCTIGNTYAVGGHLHFGYGFRYMPPEPLVFCLDKYLGEPTIDLSGLARQYYRRLSAIETKDYGFEYRSCPAAIFDKPRMLWLALKIGKNVCEKFANGHTFFIGEYGCGEREYVEEGILTKDEYDEWMRLLLEYDAQGQPYDCRMNWADESELSAPMERIPSQAEQERLAEERRLEDEEARITQERINEEMRNNSSRRLLQQECSLIDHMGITFNDDWHPDALTIFRDTIRSTVNRDQYNVFLFGLSRNRGSVTYGYDFAEDMGNPTYIRLEDTGGWSMSFGIPWEVRMMHVDRDIIHAHALSVREEIERRISVREGMGMGQPEESIFVATPDPVAEPELEPENSLLVDPPEAPYVEATITRAVTDREWIVRMETGEQRFRMETGEQRFNDMVVEVASDIRENRNVPGALAVAIVRLSNFRNMNNLPRMSYNQLSNILLNTEVRTRIPEGEEE